MRSRKVISHLWLRRCVGLHSAVLGAALLILGTGCQHQALADRRMQSRVDKLSATVNEAANDLPKRAEKLSRWPGFIEKELQRDAAKLDRDLRELDRLAAKDVQRWVERQPDYQKGIARELWGKPERIEPTFIELFY